MPFSHSCDCGKEIISATAAPSVYCPKCKTMLTGLKDKDWDEDPMEMDEEYDPVKDKNKSAAQLWGVTVSRFFNIHMRLDKAVGGTSNVGSVVPSRAVLAKFAKKTSGAKVSGVKGGRKGGGTVMSAAARDVSLRGTAYTHADEEWLHLWGDNLGGPSEAANFVAGSYAANTEMLVIEQALAFNIDKTKDLKIEVAADCSKEHVGEYVYYRLGAPKFGGKHFEHVIDLDNRTFTSSDMDHVDSLVAVWLKDNGLLV